MPAVPRSDVARPPVRSGEDLWTSDELGQVRADLASEAAGLHAGVVQAAADIAGGRTGSARDAGDDEADAGTKTAEREHELAAAQNAQDLLDQGERALARLDAGTYGVCESCGQPVGKARLLAFPRASLCLVCKQRQERR